MINFVTTFLPKVGAWHPLQFIVIWMLSILVMLPLTVVRSVDHYPLLGVGQAISVCHEHWPRT